MLRSLATRRQSLHRISNEPSAMDPLEATPPSAPATSASETVPTPPVRGPGPPESIVHATNPQIPPAGLPIRRCPDSAPGKFPPHGSPQPPFGISAVPRHTTPLRQLVDPSTIVRIPGSGIPSESNPPHPPASARPASPPGFRFPVPGTHGTTSRCPAQKNPDRRRIQQEYRSTSAWGGAKSEEQRAKSREQGAGSREQGRARKEAFRSHLPAHVSRLASSMFCSRFNAVSTWSEMPSSSC